MTSRDFCYWLQGFFELAGTEAAFLTTEQSKIIRAHLNMVFRHEIDPSYGHNLDDLQRIHDGASDGSTEAFVKAALDHIEKAPPPRVYREEDEDRSGWGSGEMGPITC